jgi:hypothetical protein
MYVIFPADEIILLSYGATVPRFQPRPTLDNLREPIVPLGTRPSTASNLDVSQSHLSVKKSSISSTSNSRQPSPLPQKSPRDRSPNIKFAEDYLSNNYQAELDEDNTSETDYIARSHLLDPSTPLSEFGANSYAAFNHTDDLNSTNNNQAISGKKKSKFKQKIHISLGRLGRPHSNEQTEPPVPSRLREDLDIRIANPTFTRDNLRHKNFDAFFASGEPVYSLERKDTQSVDTEPPTPTPIKTASSISSLFIGNKARSNSIVKGNSKANTNSKQQSVPPSPTTSQYFTGIERPKSAEFLRSESEKGDRCPFKKFLMTMKCF